MIQRSVDSYLHFPRRRYLSATEIHAVAIGSIAAAVLILGWGLDVAFIRQIVPGFPAMKAVTAAGFMLLSLSCLTSLRGSRGADAVAAACAAVVAVAMAVLLALPEDPAWEGTWRQLPSYATMAGLLFGGLAMLVIVLAPQRSLAAGALAFAGATPAFYRMIVLVLFQGAPPVENSVLDTMAIHTALLLVWFMLVCVVLHPRLGFAAALLRPSLRGRLLRRALPMMVAAPVSAAAASLALSLFVGYNSELLFAMTATLSVMLGVGLIWGFSGAVEAWQNEANEQASRLSRANEALEQYANSAAHDLKAPARHVLLYSELMHEAIDRGDMEAVKRHARSVRESAAEMPAMIDGFLGYSQALQTRVHHGEVRLSELVQAGSAPHAAQLQALGARIVLLQDARLCCDSALMTTVFGNLIANSLKNRRPDRPPVVRIGASRADALWTISVEDNGAGFDPDFAPVAFNPLARGGRAAGQTSGMGLAMCRSIIQSHGGEIRVDPAFRSGARVEFTLPVKAVKAERAG